LRKTSARKATNTDTGSSKPRAARGSTVSDIDLRSLRLAANLTQIKAAHVARVPFDTWRAAEYGRRMLRPASLELFLLAVDRHPEYRLVKRRRVAARR
jgi:DNA-binding transcriptional regulator YiaG